MLAAPIGTPDAIVTRVNREMDVVMNDAEVIEKLRNAGFRTRGGGTLKEVNDFVQGQHAAWGTLVKEIGLSPE
ncbi:MAG: tripartite tricarboxylate transporter substrate-binding protein [Alphaproteobacteria bacterium]|nr:tripartite tricarboxylate transporter substrate-binding protein [Alphaproteobacteria bacterium]